jgi:hypothetical protein
VGNFLQKAAQNNMAIFYQKLKRSQPKYTNTTSLASPSFGGLHLPGNPAQKIEGLF